ncbi:hypothetical protein [Cytobacillus horneckiae]|uniref:Uncharacterized protein n=1 Tax=Cytobacillus horneckiae TaxID=549687 RepID=A0A2N0ZH06_9BACI|nr:hypothetical protein [Cytobacillus horneckiae]MED2940693.1 hypothetical protein [Cytobacillus horneckiae]PKG28776.1 hypothetical protein CWS20_11865 [Cytobacillus horneckiae]
MVIKRKVPTEKLQDIQINMDGQNICALGSVVINSIEFGIGSTNENQGKGIAGFYISIQADRKPEISVHYHPHLVTKEVCEALGIEKRPSYQKGNQ